MADPRISGGGISTQLGVWGGAVSPQWGPGTKPLATKLNVISRLTLECLNVSLWYKQKMTFLNLKFNKFAQKVQYSAPYRIKNPKIFRHWRKYVFLT